MTRKIRAKRKSKDLAHRSLWKMLAALSLCLCAPFANAAGEYEAALKLFRAADYKTARIELKNLLRDQPEHITGRILLGRTELRLSNPSAGEEQIQRALLDGAHPAIVEVPLAQALFLQGKFEELLSRVHGTGHRGKTAASIWTLRGRAHLRLGNVDLAEKAFRDALNTVPSSVAARCGLASVAIKRGDLDTARQRIDEALKLQPNDVEALTIAATLHRGIGATEKALALLNHAIEESPNSVVARLERALVLLQLRERARALTDVQSIRRRFPTEPQALYLQSRILALQGNHDEAQEALAAVGTILLSKGPEHLDRHPEGHYLAGLVHFTKRDFETAGNHLEKYLRAFPGNVQASLMMARIWLDREQSGESVRLLEGALAKRPNEPELLALIAEAYRQNGQPQESVDALEKAVRLRPEATRLRARHGLGLLHIGQVDDGLDLLTRVLDEDADDVGTSLNLGYFYVSQGSYEEATTIALKVLDRQPKQLLAMNLLGAAAIGLEELDRARQIFNNALNIDPEFSPARLNLGRVAMHNGEIDVAQREFERVLASAANNVTAMSELASIARLKGNLDLGIKWVLDILATDNSLFQEQIRLGAFYLEAGRLDDARNHCAVLLEQYPANLQALGLLARTEIAEKKFREARVTLANMSRYAGSNGPALLQIARVQRRLGDLGSARYALLKAMRANAQFGEAFVEAISLELQERQFTRAFELIRALRQLPARFGVAAETLYGDALALSGRAAEAVDAYRRAHALEQSSQTVVRIVRVLRELKQFDEARNFAGNWLSKHPADVMVLESQASDAYRQGQYEEAIELFERLRPLTPESVALLNNLALAYAKTGDPLSLETAREAHRLAPKSPATLDTLGHILTLHKKPAEALEFLREAQSRAPAKLEIVQHVAAALAALNRVSEAIEMLEAATSRGPENQALRAMLNSLRGG